MATSGVPSKLWECLRKRHSGHFALLTPPCAEARRLWDLCESLAVDSHFDRDLIVHVEARDRVLAVQSARRARSEEPPGSLWTSEEDFRDALDKRGPTILLVERFETFPLELQLEWLARFRSFRERRSEVFQLVLGDVWAPRRTLAEWRSRRAHLSPPLDLHNVFWAEGYELREIEDKLRRFARGAPPIARTALVSLIHEHTAGDRRFVDLLFELLDEAMSETDLERAVFDLPGHSEVVSSVLRSVDSLSATARQKVAACAGLEVLRCPDSDPDIEALRLAALVRCSPRHRERWRIASPVVASVLRRYPQSVGLPASAARLDVELLPPHHPTGSIASEIVSEIECQLRNLIVLALSDADYEAHPLQAVPRSTDGEIYSDACDRREADRLSPHVPLVRHPLTAHLDVSDLSKIICHPSLYEVYFSGIFRDKTQFEAQFQVFNEARRTVAHNKLSSVRVLKQLADVLDFFEAAVANAAASALADPPGSLVSIDPKTSRTIPVPTQQKLVVEVVVANRTESSLSGVSLSVHFANAHGKVEHAPLHSQSLAFNGGEQRTVRIEGRLDKNAPAQLPEPSFLVRTARRERRQS